MRYVSLGLVLCLAGAAHAGPACESSKHKAAATASAKSSACAAREITRGTPDPACADRAAVRLDGRFAKAEERGGCVTTRDAASVTAAVDVFVADVTAALSPGGLAADQTRCAAAKLKAAGRAASALERCTARAVKAGAAVDAGCRAAAEEKLTKGFARAEARNPCRTSGDAAAIQDRVDALAALLAGDLGGDFALADGTTATVGDDGSVAVTVGARTVFATPAGVAPVVRTFSETFTGPTALYVFTRSGEASLPLDRFGGARRSGAGVTLDLATADGSRTATMTIGPRAADRSLVRLEQTSGPPSSSITMPVRCDAAGSFYGFGEQYNATDQRGERFALIVGEQGIGRDPALPYGIINGGKHTTYFPMPYWLDARGHGGLFLTEHRVEVDVCATNPAAATFEVVDDAPVQLVLFHGPTPLDVVRVLGDEVGRPRQPPAWASDVWIASQGGTAQVLADADALDALDIPAGVLWVQDWTGIRINFDGGFGVQYRWEADETLYPNLAGTIADLRGRGYRFLSYVNPFVAQNLQHFAPMSAAGHLIRNAADQDYVHFAPNGSSSHPDLSIPAAREYVKGFFRTMVDVYGMDGWMADFGEWAPLDAKYADGREGVAAHNRYPIDWHALSTEVMDELRPDGDWVVFTRSGWTGDQAVTQIHWVGDQEANWSPFDGLPTVVAGMLNLGISGVPYVTHDIAGFSGGPSTKELYLRWTELGAFTPYMRTHQGGKKLTNWSWKSDAETSAHFARFARIHRALAPEFQALAAAAATTSAPIVRHLMLVYPDDPGSRAVSDEYLIGDTMLVAPVVVQGATTKDVYLPPGAWYHVWTGTAYTGPGTVTVPAPIGSPPVFSRDVDRPDLRAIM